MTKLMMATLFAATALAPLAAANAATGERTDVRAEGAVAVEGQRDGAHDHARGDNRGQAPAPQAQAQPQAQPQPRPEPQFRQARPQQPPAQPQGQQTPQYQRSQAFQPERYERREGAVPGANGGPGYQGRRFDRSAQQPGQPQVQPQARYQQPQGQPQTRYEQQNAPGYADRRYDGGQRGYAGRPGGSGQAPDQYRRDGYQRSNDAGRYAARGYDRGYRQGFSQGERGGGWDRGWRNEGRFNWSGYRASHYELFRLPRYYAPYGWSYGYRRFAIGVTLDEVLFGQNYWINDPWYYRLPPVDDEYRWVRYYNDALLVDIYSGEVVDTVYGIFY